MCTVTYLPLGLNDFILTSNRDENPNRNTIEPKEYFENNTKLIYPKDVLAGGTWIGLSDKKRVICLLNGGYKQHHRRSIYKVSRGVVVKDILTANNMIHCIERLNLNDVEPFTIVSIEWSGSLKIYELVWDGVQKHFKNLENKPHIWSSSTLYTEEMKCLREQWFAEWLDQKQIITSERILNFHLNDSYGEDVSMKMKRHLVETVSVTSVKKQQQSMTFRYFDVLTQETYLL